MKRVRKPSAQAEAAVLSPVIVRREEILTEVEDHVRPDTATIVVFNNEPRRAAKAFRGLFILLRRVLFLNSSRILPQLIVLIREVGGLAPHSLIYILIPRDF